GFHRVPQGSAGFDAAYETWNLVEPSEPCRTRWNLVEPDLNVKPSSRPLRVRAPRSSVHAARERALAASPARSGARFATGSRFRLRFARTPRPTRQDTRHPRRSFP